MVRISHHFVNNGYALSVSDFPEKVVNEWNFLGFVEMYLIIGHVVDGVAVANILVCI